MKNVQQYRQEKTFWGEMRLPKKFVVKRSTKIVGVVSSVLLMLSLVDGASLAAENAEELSREGFRQLEQQQRQQQDDLSHNMKIFMTSSSSSSGDDNVPKSPARAIRRGDEAEDDEVVEMLQEEQILPKTLQAAELLLEKYEQNMEQQQKAEISQDEAEDQQRQTHHHHHHRRPTSFAPQALPLQQEEPSLVASPPVMMQMGRSASSGRSLWSDDFEKRTSELCGTSASLECGKRILSLIEGQETSELSVHMKCDLRDDFLKCIDTQKRDCLEVATKSSILPELPPNEDIKMERTKLWKVLWTAGGCVLAD